MRFIKFILLPVLLLASACTERSKPLFEHETAKPDAFQTSTPTAEELVHMPELASVLEQKKTYSGTDLVKLWLSPLSIKLLSETRLSQPKTREEDESRHLLRAMNSGLLEAIQTGKVLRKDLEPILERYLSAVEYQCESTKSSCVGLAYLKTDPSSRKIFEYMADFFKGRGEAFEYRILVYAQALKNQQMDIQFSKRFIEVGLRNQKTRQASQFLDERGREMLGSVLEIEISKLSKVRLSEEDRKWLEEIRIWDLFLDETRTLSVQALGSLAKLIGSQGLYLGPNGQVTERVRLESQLDAKDPISYQAQLLELRKRKMLVGSDVQPIDTIADLKYFFLLNRVFLNKISPDQALLLSQGFQFEGERFEKIVRSYAQTQFSGYLLKSTLMANDLFDVKIPVERLLWNTIDLSSSIQNVWGDYRSRMANVEKFSIRLAREAQDKKIEDSLRSMFNSSERSIKYSAVYPHTMALFYKLSQKGFALKFPRSNRELKSSDLFVYLYNGELESPLFNYSEDTEPLSPVEILYAFDFAVRSNLFAVVGIDPDDYIADALSRMSQLRSEQLRTRLEAIRARYNGSVAFSQLMMTCGEFKGAKPYPRTLFLEDVPRAPYLGQLFEMAATGISSRNSRTRPGELPVDYHGLFLMDSEIAEDLERARVDLGAVIRAGEAMQTSYSAFLKASGIRGDEVQKKLSKSSVQLNQIKGLKREYFTEIADRYRQTGFCLAKAAAKDFDVQDQVLKYEIEFLKQVYRDIQKLRSEPNNSGLLQQIQSKYEFTGLPSSYKGSLQISKDGIRYTNLDFWVRASRYLMAGLKTETVNLPAIAPNLSFDYGESFDLKSPLLRNMNHDFVFAQDEGTFIRSILSLLYQGGKSLTSSAKESFLYWETASGRPIFPWKSMLHGLVVLYRSGLQDSEGQPFIEPTELFEIHQEFLKLTNLSEMERFVMTERSAFQKFDPVYFSTVMLEWNVMSRKIKETHGILDFPISLMSHDLLGYNYEIYLHTKNPETADPGSAAMIRQFTPKRQGVRELAQNYYRVRSNENRRSTLLNFNPVLDQALDQSLRDLYQQEERSTRALMQAGDQVREEISRRPVDQRPRFDLDMSRTYTSPVLTTDLVLKIEDRWSELSRATGSCFKENSCPQFEIEKQ